MNVYCTINFMSMSYNLYTLENIQYYEGETCKISCFSALFMRVKLVKSAILLVKYWHETAYREMNWRHS